jgi:hypothetical protein
MITSVKISSDELVVKRENKIHSHLFIVER